MKEMDAIALIPASREEQLPDYHPDFPCITTRANLDKYGDPSVPWHWHGAAELFYMESGVLEYTTPHGQWIFPAGSAGFVNANVLHSSRIVPSPDATVQVLHLFDPAFLAGDSSGRLYSKYIFPLIASGIELIPILPDNSALASALVTLENSFSLSDKDWGYEFSLRQSLTEIWLSLLEQLSYENIPNPHQDSAIKSMMGYIHSHYHRELTVEQIAQAGLVSRRSCFRLFQEQLHTTPVLYLREYRLCQARTMLSKTTLPITEIANQCALGSSSYFSLLFRQAYGCTPSQYRKKWHNPDTIQRK